MEHPSVSSYTVAIHYYDGPVSKMISKHTTLTCIINKFLNLVLKPLLIVNTDILFMFATTTMCLPYRRLKETTFK